MNDVIDINSYTPVEKDKFFFDANIWLYLYCPIGNYNQKITRKYDSFLKKAICSKSSIFVSALILSEIFNRWTRLEFNILKQLYPSQYSDFKKDFKNTQKYRETVSTVKNVIKSNIIKISNRIDDKFSSISLDNLFENIENYDFNDNYFLIIANLEGFKIVTHDSDFVSQKISVPILTANKKALRRI